MKDVDKNNFDKSLKYDEAFKAEIEELLDKIEEHPEILNKLPLKRLIQLDKLLDISIENAKKRNKVEFNYFYNHVKSDK